MGEMLLFTVPMYYMPETIFRKKWISFYEKNEIDKKYWYIYSPKNEWKYNQVVAYIEIYKREFDIDFEIYTSEKKTFRYDNAQRSFQHLQCIGNHFHVDPSDTNDSIKQTILEFLESFRSGLGFTGRSHFLLLDEFNIQYDLMNIRSLFYTE